MHLNTSFESLLSLILLALALSKPASAIYIPRAPLFSPWPPSKHANFTQCKLDILNGVLDYEPLYVDLSGQQTHNKSQAIGTDFGTCKAYCGTASTSFQWYNFSPQFTGWLLPFLALTAQLPFEADGTWHNLMSLFISIASPQLATYSLVLTILNSRDAKRRLDRVFARHLIHFPDEFRPILTDLRKKIYKTLRMSQQEPFDLGNLRDALPLKLELQWWNAVYGVLSSQKRLFSASLATQTSWAIVAFGFTWVDAFGTESMGSNGTAYGLATALCWSWIAVVVLGWYFAGVSISDSPTSEAIEQANSNSCLNSEFNSYLNADPSILLTPSSPRGKAVARTAKLARLIVFKHPRARAYSLFSVRIAGDAESSGPLYNYAKVFVWSHMAEELINAIDSSIVQAYPGQPPIQYESTTLSPLPLLPDTATPVQPGWYLPEANITPKKIGIDAESHQPGPTSTPLEQITAAVPVPSEHGLFSSGCVDPMSPITLVQRPRLHHIDTRSPKTSDTRRSFEIELNRLSGVTRVAGRVGIERTTQVRVNGDIPSNAGEARRYLWDGGVNYNMKGHADDDYQNEDEDRVEEQTWKQAVHSRMFWAALTAIVLNTATVGSAFWLDFLTPSVGLGCRSGGILIYWMTSYFVWGILVVSARLSDVWSAHIAKDLHIKGRQPRRHSLFTFNRTHIIAVLAVLFRIIGKTLAIGNAVWIVMHSLFEFTGFYTNCWCQTNRGTAALLFLDNVTIRNMDNVSERWLGLALLTGFVCVFYITFMGFWTMKRL